MRRIFLLAMLSAAVCMYGQRWDKTKIEGDKVEQEPPTEAWLYSDENVLLLLMPYRDGFSLYPIKDKVALTRTYAQGTTISGTACTIASFDTKQQRTDYWSNVLLVEAGEEGNLVCSDKVQPYEENKRCSWEIFSYMKNKSGSMVFRLTSENGRYLDYEIRTIKTLGYDDENGRQWDGDIDVIGVR